MTKAKSGLKDKIIARPKKLKVKLLTTNFVKPKAKPNKLKASLRTKPLKLKKTYKKRTEVT